MRVEARLARDYPGAVWGLQVGADYYIDANTNWPFIVPSAATARTRRLTKDWDHYYMCTLRDVGVQESGGGITAAELRALPFPLS